MSRDANRLNRIRLFVCCQCGADAPSQAAHSNFYEHGKGRGIKADDKYTIPLCASCHAKLDQYNMGMSRTESLAWFIEKLNLVNGALAYDEREDAADIF